MSTTISNLSKDLLLMIFKNLTTSEQKQCQFVCRSWYFPAHLCVLAEINLENPFQVEKFIESIDYNPDPTYLRVVREIRIGKILNSSIETETEFNKENIKKLFFRFPNLEHVYLFNCSAWFDAEFSVKEFCEEMLKNCSRLDTFEVNELYQPNDCDLMYNYRHMTTKLILAASDRDPVESYGGFVNYITKFPRLKCLDQYITNFQSLLPAIEKLADLKSITTPLTEEDGHDFVEQYLRTKSADDKTKIMKRLSNVKELDVSYRDKIRENSIKLIGKYFTGLEKLEITARGCMDWTRADGDLFCSELLDLDFSAREETCFVFEEMLSDILTRSFPTIVNKMFRQIPPSQLNKKNRVLELHSFGGMEDDVHCLAVGKDKERDRYIEIFAHKELYRHLFKTASLDAVDELRFIIEERNYFGYFNMYSILQPFSSLKKLVLDIPEKYNEKQDKYEGKPLSQVKDVTIQATPDGQYQTLLRIYSSMFPNLERLALHYYSGIWIEDIGEFQILLVQCSLKKLTIDTTPVKSMMFKHLNKTPTDLDFLVIDVEILSDGKHHYYKTPLNLSSVTRIESTDLNGYIPGEDYLRVRVCIRNLQCLELCMCQTGDEDYLSERGSKKITRTLIHI